jgi:hypothetical protein
LPVFREKISFTLKMEAIFSSETSVETQRATRRNIPQGVNFSGFRYYFLNPEDGGYMFRRNVG